MLTNNAKTYSKLVLIGYGSCTPSGLNAAGLSFSLTDGNADSTVQFTPANMGCAFPSISGSWDYVSIRIDIGDDNTPATVTDYKLGNSVYSKFVVNNKRDYAFQKNGQAFVTYTTTFTNTSNETVNICEVGLIRGVGYKSGNWVYDTGESLFAREVLDTSITVEPNGVCTVTMTVEV